MPQALTQSRGRQRGARAGRDLVLVQDLTAGLDRRVSPTQMRPERARRLRNVRISVAGEWQPRPGWLEWLTASLGAGRPQGAQRIYLNGVTPFSLLAWGGNVYKPTDAGVAGAAVLAGLSATEPIFFPYDAELAAVFDATTVPKKTRDGTTWTQFGITAPAGAPALALAAGGALVNGNTYEFSYSYARGAVPVHESNEGPRAQIATTPGNLTINVTVVASADPQVDTINVYARDVTAGESVRRFAGTRANTNGAVTVAANNWGTAIEAPTRKNVPPALAFGVPWKNRWWAVDGVDRTILRFTEIFENQSWPTLYFIAIPFTRGDEIAAIHPLGDVLVVFGRSGQVFLIIGQTSLDFEVRPSAAAEAGALGARAVALVEQGLVHAAAEGGYIFDGATDRLLTHDIEVDWRQMIAATADAELKKLAIVYHRRDKELRIAAPVLPMYGSAGEWVLDLARTRVNDIPAWATTDRTIGGYVVWDGNETTTGNRGRIFSWSNTVGRMAEESTGKTANGADLIADYEGPEFLTGLQVSRFTDFYVEFQPADGTFALEIRVDGRTVFQPSISIAGGVATYGTATYGSATYGSAVRTLVPIDLPLEAEGRIFQVVGEYRGQDTFKWFTYGFVKLPEPEIRGAM